MRQAASRINIVLYFYSGKEFDSARQCRGEGHQTEIDSATYRIDSAYRAMGIGRGVDSGTESTPRRSRRSGTFHHEGETSWPVSRKLSERRNGVSQCAGHMIVSMMIMRVKPHGTFPKTFGREKWRFTLCRTDADDDDDDAESILGRNRLRGGR